MFKGGFSGSWVSVRFLRFLGVLWLWGLWEVVFLGCLVFWVFARFGVWVFGFSVSGFSGCGKTENLSRVVMLFCFQAARCL